MRMPSLLSITLDEVAAGLDSGTFTANDLTRTSLARVDEVQQALHAVIELNAGASTTAQLLDEELKTVGCRRG